MIDLLNYLDDKEIVCLLSILYRMKYLNMINDRI